MTKRSKGSVLAAIVWLGLLSPLAGAETESKPEQVEPKFTLELIRPRGEGEEKDTITSHLDQDRVVFDISNPTLGIGQANITLQTGTWPSQVVIRFRHSPERGFENLEGFQLKTSRLLVSGDFKSSGNFRFYFTETESEASGKPAGTLNITCEKRKETLELVFPPKIFRAEKTIHFSWVEYYLN